MQFVYFNWFLEYLVYQLPVDGATAPKYVGGLIKTIQLYMLCASVGLIIKNKSSKRFHCSVNKPMNADSPSRNAHNPAECLLNLLHSPTHLYTWRMWRPPTDFHKVRHEFRQIWYCAVLLKICQAILISHRMDNFNYHVTCTPIHTHL
jgi:hypothetical protein